MLLFCCFTFYGHDGTFLICDLSVTFLICLLWACQPSTVCLKAYSGSTIYFPQISSKALSQLAYNLFKFIDGLKVICQVEKEPLKGLANVQEIFS